MRIIVTIFFHALLGITFLLNVIRKQITYKNIYWKEKILMPLFVNCLSKNSRRKIHYRSISLKNIDEKIVNKILAYHIQQHVKMIIHQNHVGFIFLGCKDGSIYNVIHHINRINEKNHMIISIETEKTHLTNSRSTHDKNS